MCVTKSARQDFLAGIFSFGLQEVNKFTDRLLRNDLFFTNVLKSLLNINLHVSRFIISRNNAAYKVRNADLSF